MRSSVNKSILLQYATDGVLWLGEVEIHGYPVIVLAETENQAKQLLIAEHRRAHAAAKSGVVVQTWQELEEQTECSVREIRIGEVLWP